jgi:hypothetical protein
MSEMVRKQIYIQKRQEALLKRLSKTRGVSEAEIIRQAIEREAGGTAHRPPHPDPNAWKEILEFLEKRRALGLTELPYRWRREDAHEERLSRFDRKREEDSES